MLVRPLPPKLYKFFCRKDNDTINKTRFALRRCIQKINIQPTSTLKNNENGKTVSKYLLDALQSVKTVLRIPPPRSIAKEALDRYSL